MLTLIPATLKPYHGEHITVEMRIGNRLEKIGGLARYSSGKLIIASGEPNAEFDLVLDEATWNGKVLKDGAGSYGLRIE